jgi:serine/threonine protein kinase
MDTYEPGRRLTFERDDPSPSGSGSDRADVGDRLELDIVKRLLVGPSRRSQVVLVSSCPHTAEAELFVAKCFDPSFCSTKEAADFFKTPVEHCKTRALVETEAYRRLSEFQGQLVPKFQGRYRYSTGSGEATAILLEYIRDPSLDRHDELTETELQKILDVGTDALRSIHSQGVCHFDIRPSNVLWNSSTMALRFVDWEFSLFDQPAEAESDWYELRKALEARGLPRVVTDMPETAW